MTERIYVEKKPGFDIEAKRARQDFRTNLALDLDDVRIVLRYDVEGASQEDFRRAISNVFSEPAADRVYLEEIPLDKGDMVFAVEYLPGQYDQRADSAAQCIQLLTQGERPLIRTAKVYILKGRLSLEDLKRVKQYVINPVDSREASMEKPQTLALEVNQPASIPQIDGFTQKTDAEIEVYCKKQGFAMSPADLAFTRDYFRKIGRNPTATELKVIDTYWSDHCRHTTFLTELTEIQAEEGPLGDLLKKLYADYLASRAFVYEGRQAKPVTLMDVATLYVKEAKKKGLLDGLDESEEINACSIRKRVTTDRGEQDYLVMFKNETHNHPTEIEPFGGAATCLGGAIRDPLSGRAYVYQAMRVTGAGDPRESVSQTMEHKLPQRKITREAALGYSSYGNQIGLATGLVSELYHPGYRAKRMEIGAVVGAAPAENVRRERPGKGDVVVLIGGRTGRDGCGGATGSSKAHDEKSIEACGAEVQKGNPLTERKLQRLFRNKSFARMVKRCNDFGAGGVCVAIGELADSLDIDLDRVPKKYEGLDGTELAISESQERMAVVVAREDVDRAMALAGEENLEATPVATVTDTGRLRMLWNGDAIVDIERSFLDTNGAPQYARALLPGGRPEGLFDEEVQGETFSQTVKELLGDLNICSQQGLQEQFDSTIGAGTIAMPLGGKNQFAPIQAMAALIPVEGGVSSTATMMAWGCDPYLLEKSPAHGAAYAVLSSVAKLVAAGGAMGDIWLTLQEYFERLGQDEKKWGKPMAALLGAWQAQRQLGIAAIGGKDSMSGTFKELSVPPTLCSFAVCTAEQNHIITPEWKQAGNRIYRLRIQRDAMDMPDYADVKAKYAKVTALIGQGRIVSACAVERGGALAAAVKQSFGNGLGLSWRAALSLQTLTEKAYGDILAEAEALDDPDFEEIATLTEQPTLAWREEELSLEEAQQAFTQTLEKVFPTETEQGDMPKTAIFSGRLWKKSALKLAKPRVVLPVFPGTNCEYDTARAFEAAGAETEIVLIRNLTPRDIEEAMRALAEAINRAQIVAIPGGFSGGDEPDGSGKFIATTFRSGPVSEAVMNLLRKRDGLMLGICNGFQALIKLGLVPYGEIRPMREDSPTLTFNAIGRHVSRLVRTRITSANSPWLVNVQPGTIHTVAVSHGEGRFIGKQEEIDALFARGQIATQYVDEAGAPSMDIRYNPNGSMMAVEGLLSPDGRVFGKMGHSERYADGLLRNVPGEKDQKIFASGVAYYL